LRERLLDWQVRTWGGFLEGSGLARSLRIPGLRGDLI
jgi:hypothetical protein